MRWPEMFFRPKSADRNPGTDEVLSKDVEKPAPVSKENAIPASAAAELSARESALKILTSPAPLPSQPVPAADHKPVPIVPRELLVPGSYSEIPAAIEQVRIVPQTAPPTHSTGDHLVGRSRRRPVKLSDVGKLVSAKRSAHRKPRPTPTRVVLKRRGIVDFYLVNGERFFGELLSQNEKEVVLHNHVIGRVTLLRSELAKDVRKLVLTNGDQLVGEVIAESPEQVYLHHSSLGTLVIHRSQIGTEVGEARLADGSRVVGEVLGDRDGFTMIRSSTIGMVSVPTDKVAHLGQRDGGPFKEA